MVCQVTLGADPITAGHRHHWEPLHDGIFLHLAHDHTCFTAQVTNELVQMLSQSLRTSPGLPSIKPYSNYVLSVAWVTRPATGLRHLV